MKNLNQMNKVTWWKDQSKMSATFASSTVFKLSFSLVATYAYARNVLMPFKVVQDTTDLCRGATSDFINMAI